MRVKVKRKFKRMNAAVLVITMFASMISGYRTVPVKAETNTSVEETSALNKLGFNTSKAKEQLDDTVSDGVLPLGGSTKQDAQVTSMVTVCEAGIASGVYELAWSKKGNQIIDNLVPPKEKTNSDVGGLQNLGTYIGEGSDTIYNPNSTDKSHFTSCEAFDGDGNGKADQMVQLDLRNTKDDNSNPVYRIQLRYFSYSDSKKSWEEKKMINSLSILPFNIRPTQAYGYLSMAAGDYDGDGKDEIAVYQPYDDNGDASILIYEVNANGDFVETGKEYSVWYCCSKNAVEMESASNCENDYKRYIPVVNLEAISQPTDVYDDLAVTASNPAKSEYLIKKYDNDQDRVLNSYSTTGIIVDPMSGNSKLNEIELKWNWQDDMGLTSSGADKKYEIMRFAGASAGNLDADDATELFVGGYRINNPTGSDGYKLDEENYLYTTIEYKPKTREYSVENPSWIGLKSDYNNGASSMNENAIDSDIDNDENIVLSPMAVEAYAERGLGLPESVFVNGYVMGQDLSKDVLSSQTDARMTYSSKYQGISGIGDYFAQNNRFLLRFAIPVEKFGIEDGEQRGYMQAVSANFNGNDQGVESLLFTYAKNANIGGGNNPGKTEYRYIVGMVNNPDGRDKVANKSSTEIEGVYYSWMYANDKNKGDDMVYYNHGGMALSVYACDVDNDSTLVRPQKDSDGQYITPETKFKDPQILAVLQAQPYFDELDYDSSGGGTTFTKSKSTGTTDGNSTSFDLSVGVGCDFEFAVGVSFGFSQMFEYSFGREEEWEIENSVSLDTSFGTDGNDSVVLAMTPEICYHYEVWDIDTKKWQPMTIKVPQGSQTTQISVDRYDTVAKASGWNTIRGNILNNEAGDPTTYAKTTTGLTDFVAASNTIGNDEFLTTGSGTGQTTTSITIEKNESHTTSYSNSFNSETEVTVASVKGKFSIGGGKTQSSGTFVTNGSSYEGEVADLPDNDDIFNNYKFDWLFGYWTGELDGCTFPVLGYLVRNVNSQPTMPQELHVGDLSEKSATLCWQSDHTVGFFTVDTYIESADAYVQVATVSAGNNKDGKYEYVVNDLDPDSDYTFRITYYLLDGIRLRSSLPTSGVKAHTYSIKETAPTFRDQPSDTTVNAGDNAVFTVGVSTVSASKVYYTWQKYTPKGWENVSGATSQRLELKEVTAKQNEEIYRCRVIQSNNTIYSGAAMLNVIRKSADISVSATNNELTAKVTCDGKPVTAGADIVFEALNQDTGTCQMYVAKVGSNGIAKTNWKPEEAGNYQIHAELVENEIYETADDTQKIFVKSAIAFLSLGGESRLTYGDTLTLTPKLYEPNSVVGTDVEPIYNMYRISDSKSVLVAASQSGSMSDNTYTPLVAGTYKLVATYKGYKATKIFTVDNKDVIVKADITTNTPTVSVSGAATSDVDPLKNLYEVKVDGYDTIPSEPGVYTLYPKVKAGKTISTSYLNKYNILEESSVLEKAAPSYTVNIQSASNGLVYGSFLLDQTDVELTIPDDKNVVKGAKVTISARPEKGYEIGKWIINGTELTDNGNYVTNDTYVINDLNAHTDIKVEFVAKKYKVSYETKENGSISANYYDSVSRITGAEFVSGSQLGADECIILKATPLSGYKVEKWTTENGSGSETTIKTSSDLTYAENEYVVSNVNADSTIRVYYVKMPTQFADYSKVYEAIKKKPEDLSLYTEDSVERLNTALNQVVTGKDSKEQSIVDGYATDIETAIKGLKYKDADYTAVNVALNKIPEDLDNYDIRTVVNLFMARMKIRYDLPITQQNEVNAYASELNRVISNLRRNNDVYVGKKFVSNNNKYIITRHSENVHEVQFIGIKKPQKNIKIPDQVTYKNIKFKVTSIGEKALLNNTKITTVSIGNNVATIGDFAFYKAKYLKKVTIGTGLVSIGRHSFCHIKKGSLITIKSKKLEVVKTGQNHGTYAMVIKVPQSKLKDYKKLFKKTKAVKMKKI